MKEKNKGVERLAMAGLIVLALFKSVFNAITSVAWGVAGIFLTNVSLVFLLKDGIPVSVNQNFLLIETFILNHLMLFATVFFLLYLYTEIKSFKKKD